MAMEKSQGKPAQLISFSSRQGKTKYLKRDYGKGVLRKSLNRQESGTLGGEERGAVLKME